MSMCVWAHCKARELFYQHHSVHRWKEGGGGGRSKFDMRIDVHIVRKPNSKSSSSIWMTWLCSRLHFAQQTQATEALCTVSREILLAKARKQICVCINSTALLDIAIGICTPMTHSMFMFTNYACRFAANDKTTADNHRFTIFNQWCKWATDLRPLLSLHVCLRLTLSPSIRFFFCGICLFICFACTYLSSLLV